MLLKVGLYGYSESTKESNKSLFSFGAYFRTLYKWSIQVSYNPYLFYRYVE